MNGKQRECVKVSADPAWPGFMKVEYQSKIRKGFSYTEWYPIEDFIKNNPQLAHLAKDAPKPPQEDLGRVSRATETTLTDKTKNWRQNEFAGYPLWISRGKGEGQVRTVLKNDHNTLTINAPWEVIPDKTSQYVLSHNVHDPQPLGNTLPEFSQPKGIKKKIKKVKPN
jgi:hypothetical protein